MDLVGLLAENRIAEFHTCLELIAPADRDNTYIAFAVEVEQRLMEGSYNKVLMARKQVPDVTYSFFMDTLGETVRDRISECSEVAYETFPLHKAQDLLMMDSQAQLQEYMAKRGWQVQGDSIVFSKDNEKDLDLASLPMLKQQLGYAQELERII